jgi:hypothetical protein
MLAKKLKTLERGRRQLLSIVALVLPGVAHSQGPYRTGMVILLKHDKAAEPRVTIRSAVT